VEAYMKISMIVAMDENNGIGKDNKLLWHLPEDFKHFKDTTRDSVVIMGRKTYESLPKKPLKDRVNIVLTRDESYVCEVSKGVLKGGDLAPIECHDMYDVALWLDVFKNKSIYVIGGQNIYEQFMPYVDELIVTHVYGKYEADAFFPKIEPTEWKSYAVRGSIDNSFHIEKYIRK
jgi:dihydrofolate reductase